MKRILSIVLVLVLGLMVAAVPALANVSEPQVTVDPVLAAEDAEYTIVFDAPAGLTLGFHDIVVEFPAGTTVPGAYDAGDITVNTQPANTASGALQVVTILSPVGVDPDGTVTVVFTLDAGITNPPAGDYTLDVSTTSGADTTVVPSATYTIDPAPVGPVDLYDETMDFMNSYNLIQDAIDAADVNYTIEVVTAGPFTEDLVIPAGLDGLEIVGVFTSKPVIKGVASLAWASYPNGAGATGIEILSNEVKLHGFIIETPDLAADHYAFNIVLTGTDIEIYDNDFVGEGESDSGGVAIQTYRVDVMPTSDITGLKIYDNTFDATAYSYQGVFINRDSADGLVTITDNVFTGEIHMGIANEGSNAVITGNEMTSTTFAGSGIVVMDWDDTRAQDDVLVDDNTVDGMFVRGIVIGHSSGDQDLTNITVTNNTIDTNGTGVLVRSSADGVVVNFNSIDGNNTIGVDNTDTDVELDATCNWWGALDGPGAVGTGTGDLVSVDVLFAPWCVRVQLVEGWNLVSSPFIPSNTAIETVLAGIMDDVISVWHWDTTGWLTYVPGGPSDLATMEDGKAYWINMDAAADLFICGSALAVPPALPPAYDVVVGWNMVGFKSIETTITAANYMVGNTWVRIYGFEAGGWELVLDGDDMEPGMGYWVAFTAAGTIYP